MDRERVLHDRTVVVVGDRIQKIGPAASIEIPRDATVISGDGKYLMPGLADMHAHTWDERDFPLLLANGVTAIRNMFGGRVHLDWRKRIAAGELPNAPTIYTAGPIIDGNPPIWPGAVVENAEQAQRIVAEQHAAGYDFVKVYSRLSRQAFEAIAQAAKAHGMPVGGHVPEAVDLGTALRTGINSIEHLSGYEFLAKKEAGAGEEALWARLDESQFASIANATAKSNAWNCPTLVLFQHRIAPGETQFLTQLLQRPEMKYVPADIVESWRPENNFLKNTTPARASSSRNKGDVLRKKLVKALHDAGARLLLGTDYGNPFVVPGFSLHAELRNFVAAGLSPYEALRAGTSGAAEFMNATEEFGTIAVGRRADLILSDRNPLEDVAHVSRPVGVMMRGRWWPNGALSNGLEELAVALRAEKREN